MYTHELISKWIFIPYPLTINARVWNTQRFLECKCSITFSLLYSLSVWRFGLGGQVRRPGGFLSAMVKEFSLEEPCAGINWQFSVSFQAHVKSPYRIVSSYSGKVALFNTKRTRCRAIAGMTVSEILQLLCAPDPTPIPPQFWGCSRCAR